MAFYRQFKGVFEAAIDLFSGVDPALGGDFIGSTLLDAAADTGVDAAGIFTDDDVINIFRAFACQRGFHARIKFDRAEVDVLIEFKAQTEQDALFQDTGFDFGLPMAPRRAASALRSWSAASSGRISPVSR